MASITTTSKIIELCLKADVPFWLWGDAGIGKSELVRQICEKLDIKFIPLYLATQEVSDLIGIPKVIQTNGNMYTAWAAPEWFPQKDEPTLVFLDELNRAPRDVTQAIFPFVTKERRIHTHILPAQGRIGAASNPPEQNFDVRKINTEKSFMTRFCHINVENERSETISYFKLIGLDKIASYVENSSIHLSNKIESKIEGIYCPRTLEMMGKIVNIADILQPDTDTLILALSGCVGFAGATDFIQWSRNINIVTAKMIIEGKVSATEITTLKRTDIVRIVHDLKAIIEKTQPTDVYIKNVIIFLSSIDEGDILTGFLSVISKNDKIKSWHEKFSEDDVLIKKLCDINNVNYNDLLKGKVNG